MRILIAPNAFKHSLDAEEVAKAIGKGLMNSKLDCQCDYFPIGDGGDGTGELLIKKCKGTWQQSTVNDPIGRKIKASYGLIDDGQTAVIEMANASGLRLLTKEELNPLIANSYGTGQQIKEALDKGVKKIIVAMGGSATVDGATGMLKALGTTFLNDQGYELNTLPIDLLQLSSVDTFRMDKRLFDCKVIVLCDVDNELLGDAGAAAMFGPQKGASPANVATLDAALAKLAATALQQTGKDISTIKYGGTAGGAAAGLYAFANAQLVNGIDYLLDITGFDAALEKADLVITGEGSIDEQTLQGKGPFGVAYRAKQKGVPVVGVAGKIPLQINRELQQYFDVLLPIGNQPTDLHTAFENTAANLERTFEQIGNSLALKLNTFVKFGIAKTV